SSTSRQTATKVAPDIRVILDREWRQLLKGQPLDAIRSSAFVYFVDTIKVAGDTELTPFWAFSICLWSTIFLEIWKRRQSLLALRWNVDHFSSEEPDRPQFYGTMSEMDPLTGEVRWHYPLRQRALKYVVSFAFFTL
ncbi:hypothetical protein BIW11_13743, partial [Tropilaelaps mercedesae]